MNWQYKLLVTSSHNIRDRAMANTQTEQYRNRWSSTPQRQHLTLVMDWRASVVGYTKKDYIANVPYHRRLASTFEWQSTGLQFTISCNSKNKNLLVFLKNNFLIFPNPNLDNFIQFVNYYCFIANEHFLTSLYEGSRYYQSIQLMKLVVFFMEINPEIFLDKNQF